MTTTSVKNDVQRRGDPDARERAADVGRRRAPQRRDEVAVVGGRGVQRDQHARDHHRGERYEPGGADQRGDRGATAAAPG